MPEFVTETLWTDTRTYEVIGRTDKTIKVRTTRPTGESFSENRGGNPWPVTYTFVGPDPNGKVRTCRLRKDGTYRMGNGANPLRPSRLIDGKPYNFTDYRF